MRAEVIAIGDELTSGQRLDTNSQWLSERLGELGVEVAFHTTVGDRLSDNIAVFRQAIDRAEIVVATGGLGPTADDLTRDAIAMAVGVELVQDETALTHIRQLFARRGRAMPERNLLQAQFPRGSRVVPNPHGTAPGIDLTVTRPCCPPCRVFALPGVPDEMYAMWTATVAPAILAAQGTRRVIRHRRIKCFGVGESDLEAMLPDMIRRQREPLVGITVSGATITLRITARGPNDAAARREMEPTVKQIYDILGILVFGEEEDELEHAVVRLLHERQQTVAVAEWATDGLVGQWLAEAAGSLPPPLPLGEGRVALDSPWRGEGCPRPEREGSKSIVNCFRGGVLIRDPDLLRSLLGIAVDPEASAAGTTAATMARAVRDKSKADWGLGIAAFPVNGATVATTVAGSAESKELTGTLHVALAAAENVQVKAFPLASHPAITKTRSAKQALNMLRLALLNQTK